VVARGVRPKSAIAEISTRVRGADKNTGAPCDATASGVFRQLPDLLPVFYPDLEKEFAEVRSGSEIGNRSHFCPRTLQPQAFPAEASQTMKQSTLRPKSAITENSTRGRMRGASEIGNCRNQHQGSRGGCVRNRQLPKSAPWAPHNHLTANLATTNGSKGAYLLDARLHPFIPFHCISQETVFIQLKSDGAIGCIMIVMALYF